MFYFERMNTVEVNSTFYHFSRVTTYQKWCKAPPRDFKIVHKANRYFTHEQGLLDPENKMDELLNRARSMGPRLGPILFQLPPSLKADNCLLRRFIAQLPENLRFAIRVGTSPRLLKFSIKTESRFVSTTSADVSPRSRRRLTWFISDCTAR